MTSEVAQQTETIAQRFRAELARCASGQVSLADLFRWLAGHAQEITSASDEPLVEFEAEVWIRLDDVDEGLATEEEFRTWLAKANRRHDQDR